MPIFGIDLSHHQGVFDLGLAKREGVEFGVFKATEGATYQDARFAANLANGRNAGLACAAYHYVRAGQVPEQVRNIERTVPKNCPLILDVEANSGDIRTTMDLNTRLTAAGYRMPLLYLPRWYWQQIGSPDLRGLPPLWSSRYPDNNGGTLATIYGRVPASYWNGYGGLSVAMLQFTSSATVAGRTPVDGNAYPGSRVELQRLFGGQPHNLIGALEAMAFSDTFKDSFGNTQTVLSWMNHQDETRVRLDQLCDLMTGAGTIQSRIPGDTNRTNGVDLIADSASWTHQTMWEVRGQKAAIEALSGLIADGTDLDADEIASKVQTAVATAIRENVVRVDIHGQPTTE